VSDRVLGTIQLHFKMIVMCRTIQKCVPDEIHMSIMVRDTSLPELNSSLKRRCLDSVLWGGGGVGF